MPKPTTADFVKPCWWRPWSESVDPKMPTPGLEPTGLGKCWSTWSFVRCSPSMDRYWHISSEKKDSLRDVRADSSKKSASSNIAGESNVVIPSICSESIETDVGGVDGFVGTAEICTPFVHVTEKSFPFDSERESLEISIFWGTNEAGAGEFTPAHVDASSDSIRSLGTQFVRGNSSIESASAGEGARSFESRWTDTFDKGFNKKERITRRIWRWWQFQFYSIGWPADI